MLVVTEVEVQRGYVEGGASLFEIWTNDPAECALTVKSSDFLFREAAVIVMGGEIIINPTGGMIVIPVRVRQQIALDSRLSLPLKRSPAPTHGPSPFPLFRCEGAAMLEQLVAKPMS